MSSTVLGIGDEIVSKTGRYSPFLTVLTNIYFLGKSHRFYKSSLLTLILCFYWLRRRKRVDLFLTRK